MSLVNVFVCPERAVMLTDSSFYRADGTITDFDQKAFLIDSWNGAIGFRGNMLGMVAGTELADRYSSFDEFIALSGPMLQQIYSANLGAGNLSAQSAIEIHAVGWSEQADRARAFMLQAGFPRNDRPSFVWIALDSENEGGAYYGDLSARALWRLHRRGAEPNIDFTPDTFHPVAHGIPLVEEQRQLVGDPRASKRYAGLHIVGGDLWAVIVQRTGTSLGIIHSWPDEVGKPIVPEVLDESLLPPIAPFEAEEAGYSFARWMEALDAGLFDPETFKVRRVDSRRQRRAAQARARHGLRVG